MDRATQNFLSQSTYGYSPSVQPTVQATTVMGQSPYAWDASYYSPSSYSTPDLPSLPSWQQSNIDPSQWTSEALGGTSQQQPKSVTTTAYGANYGMDPNAISNAFAAVNPIDDAFSNYNNPITAAFNAIFGGQVNNGSLSTAGLSSGGKAQGGFSSPSYGGGGSVSSSPAYASNYSPQYGDQVQLASGGTGTYMSQGLAIDDSGRYVGYDPNSSSSSGSSSGSACYLTTAAIEGHEADNGPTLTALRWFRDHIMGGKSEVAEYYATAPGIVAWIDAHPKRERIYQAIRRHILAPCVSMIERGEFEKTHRLYKRMVRFLEAKANG